MVVAPATNDDGSMEDTKNGPDPSAERASTESDRFDAHRLRTIADMRRSRDDRMLAGVCSGAAKYLNVDPVVIRVVIAVLTFVGLSGLILYLAAWFFLPAEGTQQSIAADWFNLDKNEEQIRIIGLVAAAVLAAVAIVGDDQWAWGGLPWVLIPLAILYWFFVVRPRRRDRDDEPSDHEPSPTVDPEPDDSDPDASEATSVLPATDGSDQQERRTKRKDRRPGSSALIGLTLSVAAIAVAITVLVGEANDGVAWTTYVAVALGVVTAGLLVGTFFGRPGPLIPIGLVLAAGLAVGSLMPSGGFGEKVVNPQTAAAVDGHYKHGLGVIRFDLTDVDDADQLLGSTIRLENGAGDIKVTVPDDLNVAIDAHVGGGEIRAFGRKSSGTDASLIHPPDDAGQPVLTLRIRETFGGIEVIER
jgi:phage shock protein PspC (stress-responsive transcriptional regulator)